MLVEVLYMKCICYIYIQFENTSNNVLQFLYNLMFLALLSTMPQQTLLQLSLYLLFHQEYCGLEGLSMSDVADLVEQSRDTLDDVWRQTDFEPYPELRMVRLMDVIGRTASH